MASNPMQKKARNAFLLGFMIMLVIALLVGALLYFTVIKEKEQKKAEEEVRVEVVAYALNQPVKGGKPITSDMLTPITVYNDMIPANYIDANQFYMFELKDKKGNEVLTGVERENGQVKTDVSGYPVTYNYIKEQGKEIKIKQDGNGYYKANNEGGVDEYIDLLTVPVLAKIDMEANTILTTGAMSKGKITANDLRMAEFNVISLPMMLELGDFVDIRMMLANGQDMIVVSKKEVINIVGDTIAMNLTEDEILMLNCAIVESYKLTASIIYAIPYVEPGLQDEAIPTYPVNAEVVGLIERDPNITFEAYQALAAGLNERGTYLRDTYISPEIMKETESAVKSRVEQAMQKQKENAKKARESYLKSLQEY